MAFNIIIYFTKIKERQLCLVSIQMKTFEYFYILCINDSNKFSVVSQTKAVKNYENSHIFNDLYFLRNVFDNSFQTECVYYFNII